MAVKKWGAAGYGNMTCLTCPPGMAKLNRHRQNEKKSICEGPTQLNECMGNAGERANASKESEVEKHTEGV